MKLRAALSALAVFALLIATAAPALAQRPSDSSEKDKDKESSSSSESKSASAPAPEHVRILRDAKPVNGLWHLHQKGEKLYWEIGSGDYSAEYIVLISISRGIAQGQL